MSEKISVPLGYGHFEKGINHLRDNFSQGLGLNPEERIAANSDECRKRLDNKCKGFKKPTLDMAYLQALGKGTIDTCVETAKALSNEELGAFLKGFQDHSRRVGKKTDDNKEASSMLLTLLNPLQVFGSIDEGFFIIICLFANSPTMILKTF
ncbi:hypothetical protein [Helicobacter fennelliae]|uniref:hypothetical protein n=1 Tax=Helicobacter fennelliae TaxID=215 RepID=UPI0011BD458E|nr:hypothetical protein [Helicobacter fennelliae]